MNEPKMNLTRQETVDNSRQATHCYSGFHDPSYLVYHSNAIAYCINILLCINICPEMIQRACVAAEGCFAVSRVQTSIFMYLYTLLDSYKKTDENTNHNVSIDLPLQLRLSYPTS